MRNVEEDKSYRLIPHMTPSLAIRQYLLLLFFFSQAEYLHEVATIYESFTGVDHWWIGLSDVGGYYNFECIIFFFFKKTFTNTSEVTVCRYKVPNHKIPK
jgi:hypothetical protein